MTEIRTLEGALLAEHYLAAAAASAPGLFARTAAALAQRRVQPIVEKVYGLASAREAVLAAREGAFRARGLDPSTPVTYVEGRPADASEVAGVQVWGVTPRGGEGVRTVELPGGSGRLWSQAGARFLYIPAVFGRGAGAAEQARGMFANAAAALASQGFSYAEVVRTWIYLARILDWYGDFNRVRTEEYGKLGLVRAGAEPDFPASTGVQGRHGDEECFMALLAIDPGPGGDVIVRPIRRSSRQDGPFAYGSAFSRAVSVEREGRRTIYVSGTASIGAAGRTLHPDDPEAQAVATLANVAGLLEEQGGGLESIVMATIFAKDRESLEAYRRAAGLRRVPDFPAVAVLADICRPELRVEIEAVAVV